MHRDTMTSHAFALNLKRYAAVVGIARIHLHQTLHTFARMVSDDMGSPGRVLVGGGQIRARVGSYDADAHVDGTASPLSPSRQARRRPTVSSRMTLPDGRLTERDADRTRRNVVDGGQRPA